MRPVPDAPKYARLGFGGAALFYLLWTCLLFWPVLQRLTAALPIDRGDPALNAAILQWNATTLPLTSAWWNFPSFAPAAGATAFTEHLLGLWPLTSPLVWLTDNAVLAHNIAFLLSFPFAALAMFALVRWLTGSAIAGLVAGAAFAFNPYRNGQLAHLQMLLTFGMPLALYGLHCYVDGQRRGLLLFAAGWAAASLSNAYFLVFFGVYLACWLLWFVPPAQWRRAVPIVAVWSAASIPLLPIVAGYIRIHDEYGLQRTLTEIRTYSADVIGVFLVNPAASIGSRLLPAVSSEGALFPGLVLVLLACVGLWRRLRTATPRPGSVWGRVALTGVAIFGVAALVAFVTDLRLDVAGIRLSLSSPDKPFTGVLMCAALWLATTQRVRGAYAVREPALFYAVAGVLMWLLSLGPEMRFRGTELAYLPPYAWLLAIPGVEGVRVPARFWMLGIMSLAVLAGYALTVRTVRSIAAATVLTLLILAEGWTTVTAVPVEAADGLVPPDRNVPVLVLPAGNLFEDAEAQRAAVAGGYRVMNGYSGFDPPHYHPLRRGLQLREAGMLTAIRSATPLYVNVRADNADGWRDWVLAHAGTPVLAAESGGRALYRLERVAAAGDAHGQPLAFVVAAASCNDADVGRIADASYRTGWECMPSATPQQVVVDLQAMQQVSGVGMGLGALVAAAPREVRIEGSPDASSWSVLWIGNTLGPAVRAALERPTEVELTLSFAPAAVRYLRLTDMSASGSSWGVAELRVFAAE